MTRSGASGRGSVRKIALADLTAMFRAARAAGAPFAVQSAYRSYKTQVSTFNRWVLEDGYAAALLGSARPGHSEHQLGTVLDLKTPGGPEPWDVADWGRTRAGAWIARNAWRYGWIVSYPKAKSPAATCYQYEPWHVRYFGRTIAPQDPRLGSSRRASGCTSRARRRRGPAAARPTRRRRQSRPHAHCRCPRPRRRRHPPSARPTSRRRRRSTCRRRPGPSPTSASPPRPSPTASPSAAPSSPAAP